MGGVGQLVCQGFLVREACVSVLVCGNGFFSLEHNGVFSNEFYNGKKTTSLTSGTGKTGQPLVKE